MNSGDMEAFTLIEEIRNEIRALDYEPLDDQALAEMHAAIEDAVEDNESESKRPVQGFSSPEGGA